MGLTVSVLQSRDYYGYDRTLWSIYDNTRALSACVLDMDFDRKSSPIGCELQRLDLILQRKLMSHKRLQIDVARL